VAAAPEQQPDSATLADSVAAAEADRLAQATRDSIRQDSLDLLMASNEQLRAERDRAARERQQNPPRETQSQPAPQPQYGKISVNVLEPGFGTVYIDDRLIKDTPLIDFQVLAGQHVIRITNPGCQDWVDTVRVAIDQTVRRSTVTMTCGG
jgi:hypothetical protein